MKKRVVSMLLALVMIVTMVVTSIPTLAATPVQLKVTADNAAPSPGDKVNFTVLLGSVANAGTLQFTLKIPTGLTIDDSSISIPDDLTTVMDSDGAIVKPSSSNGYTWGWSAQNNGYTGTSDLKLVGFSCTVDDGITGEKSVTIDVSAFTDNDELTPIEHAITPATVNIAAAPATYTVTYYSGGTSEAPQQVNVTGGQEYTLIDCPFTAPEDKEFSGWTVSGIEGQHQSGYTFTITGNVIVNAVWKDKTPPAPTTYTVTVNGGTGVTANSTQTVNQGEAITDVVIEAWDNYYFPERYGENSGKFGIAVTRNSPSKITVSGTPTADVTINLPAAAMKAENPNIPSVTPVHCTAAGNDGKITGVDASMEYKKGATGDTWYIVGNKTEITGLAPGTYYVRYKATPTQKASAPAEVKINAYDPNVQMFTITFNPNGGNGDTKVVTVPKGSNYVIQNAAAYGITAQDGMRFVYWSNREDNGQGSEQYSAGYEYRNVQSNLTFYAVWETTARTVFLNAGEGGGDDISVAVTYDQTYTLPGVPETFTAPNGKEFDCWKIQGDNTNTSYNPGATYTIKSNVTFVAQWKVKQGGGEQPTTFTLTFKPGEGSGDNYVVNGIDTPQYTLPDVPDTFTAPAGKPNFAGWKAEGGNVVYPAGTVIPVNADATFVAQWRADGPQGDTVLVTFKPGDGKGDAFELRVPAGDSYRLPAKPAGFKAPAGKVFAGWKIEDPQGNLNEKLYKAGYEFSRLTEDVTFVAQWKTRPYYGDDTTTPDADPMVNPGTGAAPVGAPIAVVIAVAVAGAAYFVTTKKR